MLFRVYDTPILNNQSYIYVFICFLEFKMALIFLTPFLLLSFQPTIYTTLVFSLSKNEPNEQELNVPQQLKNYLSFSCKYLSINYILCNQMISMIIGRLIYNKIIYVNIQSKMHLADESHVIRYVNTFTVGDWEGRKNNQRNRKGITRVTKSNSQSADKYSQMAYMRNHTNLVQNQNRNESNIHEKQMIDYTSLEHLIERIKNLELQLTLVEKQKIQLQRKVEVLQSRQRPNHNLIESHYISSKQDFDSLLLQKEKLAENITSLQAENNFLKINIGIHEQYILKVHSQLDEYRAKDTITQKEMKEISTQTDKEVCQIDIKLMPNKGMQTDKCDISLHLQQNKIFSNDETTQTQTFEEYNQLEYLKQLGRKFQEQTNDFSIVIQKLQEEKILLLEEAQRLAAQLKIQQVNKQELLQLTNQLKRIQSQKIEAERAMTKLKLNLTDRRELEILKEQIKKILNEKQQIEKLLEKQKFINEDQIKQIDSHYQQLLEESKTTSQFNLSSQAKYYQQMLKAKTIQSLQRANERDEVKLKQNQTNNIFLDRLRQTEESMLSNKLKENRNEGQIQILKRLLNQEKQKSHKYYLQFIQLQRKYEVKIGRMEEQRAILEEEFKIYRKQLDSLLGYLQQKNYILQERQMKIAQKLQTQEIIHKKNQQTLKLQTKMEAMIIFNQNRVKKIQDSLQEYVKQILSNKYKEEQQYKRDYYKNISQLKQQNKLLRARISQLTDASQRHKINQKTLLLVHKDNNKENQENANKLRLQVFELSQKYQQEVIEKTNLKEQLYKAKQVMKNEQRYKKDFRLQIQQIQRQYSFKISQMQSTISSFERQMRYLEQRLSTTKNEYQARLVQVKKDYDVLYSKYLKYKSLSVHLQEINNRKV